MARVLQHFVERSLRCGYLPDRASTMENKVIAEASAEELEAMLVRGWRRFGPVYFRPACNPCGECVPLRIPVAEFSPSKSQRRAARATAALRAVLGPPQIDDARLRLYHAWHAQREIARDWAPAGLDAREYGFQFAFPHPAVRELAYWDDAAPGGPRLVGVGICDETPAAWSAVYFFYDPAYARASIGVANVLRQIELARARGIPHVYLGYRILPCASMQYKARFRQHELLVGRPAADQPPEWRRG